MTNRPEGKLYRSPSVEHPDAKVVSPSRRISKQMPTATRSRVQSSPGEIGLNPAQLYFLLAAPVIFLAALEGKFSPSTNWFFTIAWIALSLFLAIRAAAETYWATWTAPPIIFAIAILIHLNLSGKGFGGIALTQLLGLLFGLSERMWVILGVTGLCWFIAKRKLVANRKAHRALKREGK
jgi:hypothetical protein